MAFTTIDNPELYFQTLLHVGNNTSFTFAGSENMQPDLIWNKNRDSSGYHHHIIDSVRGVSKLLRVSSNIAEFTSSDSITAIGSDGFTVGADSNGYVSSGTDKQVSWCWKAGGTASSNTDGSITSSVSHNSTSGFSIGTYTGTGTAGDTVGHGLNANPDVLIVKERGNANSWVFSHKGLTNQSNYVMLLNTNDAQFSDTFFNSTSPTSSVFSTNGSPTNRSGGTYVFYAFTEKKGYSKFCSYTGNGSTDGTFVYTGFKPAWFICKKTDSANSWNMFDNKRSSSSGSNEINYSITANETDAEETGTTSSDIDFCSNGIKIREDNGGLNGSGGTYIYMAFAENPFVTSTGIPTTAR